MELPPVISPPPAVAEPPPVIVPSPDPEAPPAPRTLAACLELQPAPWPPESVRAVLDEILLDLARAHATGACHGPFGPEEVRIPPDGKIRLTGFGLAPESTRPADDLRATARLARFLLTGTEAAVSGGSGPATGIPGDWQEWLDRTFNAPPGQAWDSAEQARLALPGQPAPRPARVTRILRRLSGTLAALCLLASATLAVIWALPRAQEAWSHALAARQAGKLAREAGAHLSAGRLQEAAVTARESLLVLPDEPQATAVLAEATAVLERQRQREQAAATALAAAEQLVTDDDVPAALAAFHAIRDNPAHPQETIHHAEQRILALRETSATLALPPDWPPDAHLWIDGRGQVDENGLVTGIRLGTHEIAVARDGYRTPPPVKLEFRGRKPVPLPPPVWVLPGGKVALASKPSGAAVWHQGADTGHRTPCTFEDVGPGKVEYLLKLDGYRDRTVGGEVPSAALLELSATMEEKPRLPVADGTKAGERQEFDLAPGLRVPFRWCPAGAFPMGGSDRFATPREKPVRIVRLTRGFWLGETEVTQAQWHAVTGRSLLVLQTMAYRGAKAAGEGPDHPVYFVSWDQICGDNSRSGGFLGKVNAFLRDNGNTAWLADLPTEAQWEYACRAGSRTAFANGIANPADLDRVAWFASNSNGAAHPVATKAPNAWGFHDVHGNVLEWCRDWFQRDYRGLPDQDPAGPASGGWERVVRGGARNSPAALCRSAARDQASTTTASALVGFRLALRRAEP